MANTLYRYLKALSISVLLAFLSGTASMALAQAAYPTRVIKLVVPYAAGGPLDPIMRLIMARMSERLGQPIIIESKGGGGGSIGLDYVAQSPPDGYTWVTVAGTGIYNYHFLNRDNFNYRKEFASLGQIYSTPLVVMVNPAVPAMKDIQTVQQLIAYSKTQPQLPVTGAGLGSTSHLLMGKLSNLSGAKFVYVPYKGLGPALNDVLAGVVPVYVGTITQASLVKSGRLRALAIAGETRELVLPDVPTLSESGFPGLFGRAPVGIALPVATPPAIVSRLVTEFKATLAEPEIVEKLNTAGGIRVSYLPPDRFADILMQDFDFWGKVIRDNNIKAE